MPPTHAKKRDQNEGAIVDALEDEGCFVAKNDTGKGQPDLVCVYRGVMFWAEVKVPGKKLRTSQEDFIKTWPGKVYIVTTPEEAIAAAMAAWVERMDEG